MQNLILLIAYLQIGNTELEICLTYYFVLFSYFSGTVFCGFACTFVSFVCYGWLVFSFLSKSAIRFLVGTYNDKAVNLK